MRQQPERAEQAAIVELLELLGAKVYVLGTRRPKGDYPGTRQTPGLPDLLVFLPRLPKRQVDGRWQDSWLLCIEVKAPRGRMSPEQFEFRDHCEHANVSHVYGGVDQMMAWLERFGYLARQKRA